MLRDGNIGNPAPISVGTNATDQISIIGILERPGDSAAAHQPDVIRIPLPDLGHEIVQRACERNHERRSRLERPVGDHVSGNFAEARIAASGDRVIVGYASHDDRSDGLDEGCESRPRVPVGFSQSTPPSGAAM